MNYQITITGMHCKGCAGLIKMSLEEVGLANVEVDIQTHLATFTTDTPDTQVLTQRLNEIFAGLPGYAYDSLKQINS